MKSTAWTAALTAMKYDCGAQEGAGIGNIIICRLSTPKENKVWMLSLCFRRIELIWRFPTSVHASGNVTTTDSIPHSRNEVISTETIDLFPRNHQNFVHIFQSYSKILKKMRDGEHLSVRHVAACTTFNFANKMQGDCVPSYPFPLTACAMQCAVHFLS